MLGKVELSRPIIILRGHWTPTGAEPMEQWMDGWIIILLYLLHFTAFSEAISATASLELFLSTKFNWSQIIYSLQIRAISVSTYK